MPTKKLPKVSLINRTQDPLETMCFFRRVMHSPVPDKLQDLIEDPQKWLGYTVDEYVKNILMRDGMPTFLETVQFVFKLENVSRALTHQLVRHRIGFSFSQQSMRCVDVPNFASNCEYYNPGISVGASNSYHEKMLKIQEIYREALAEGMNTQDARGLAPTNIQTTILFSCTFRALIDMVNKRLCYKTQEEFGAVAQQIVGLVGKVDPRLTYWFKKPCDKGYCMMQGENEEQIIQHKFTGKQNTDHCCPIYLQKWGNGRQNQKSFEGVQF
jgi:thymidylate synthase (FAD)